MVRNSRRAAAKPVNYAAEQEFSDGDVFEDSPGEEPTPVKKKRSRKSGGTRVVETFNDDAEDDGVYRPPKPIFTEKGYDSNLPPIRERFPFMPEYEADGSPKIDLIVGRRPIDENENKNKLGDDDDDDDDDDDNKMGEDAENNNDANDDHGEDGAGSEGNAPKGRSRRRRSSTKASKAKTKKNKKRNAAILVEYEYLIKYKGKSYMHLEWKRGADLESMGKTAKGMYRRYLKKVAQGIDDELEDPNFDPTYVTAQKIIDQAEQEMTVELSDKELLKWEKQREKELAAEEGSDDEDIDEGGDATGDDKDKENANEDDNNEGADDGDGDGAKKKEADAEDDSKENNGDDGDDDDKKDKLGESEDKEKDPKSKDAAVEEWGDEEIDFSALTIERLRGVLIKDGPYYPVFPNCNNPYRDGYVTEPPKRPRACYLFFQCAMRSYFQKRNKTATQGELMTILGDHWRTMTDEQQAPFIELANEEARQYEKEKAMLEKAQKPNEMWQPIRRCRMVLERLEKDSFADIFLEPVDLEDFPDYEDIIDQPMDLGTIRKRLNTKKYQGPEQFARDMRKVWNNCKIYNRHGSAIWHVADYMSKQFERLYHAWVLEFRERYLRWAQPKARPWEHTCRAHDGKCGTKDDHMVLCDHCDAMYGFRCVKPPLKRLPKGIWHCPDCKPKLHSVRGVRMMSAIAEQAARKRAELGDTPKRKVKQMMYLVKWVGLGYEHCTWETKDDIGNLGLIVGFHKLNNSYPDEPDMPAAVIEKHLDSTKHIQTEKAGGQTFIPHLRSQLYAQTRAFHFTKFGLDVPALVSQHCGSRTKAITYTPQNDVIRREVLGCLTDLVERTATNPERHIMTVTSRLPPLMSGEYDAIIPITSKGLMMNVGEINGSVAFLGYRQFPDGSAGPSEIKQLVRNPGDKIIAVDGTSTAKKSFKEVINILRESGKNKFAVMRFLENKLSVCAGEIASVGAIGRFVIESLKDKFATERRRAIANRKDNLLEEEQEEEKRIEESDGSADEESDEESEGSFEPESDEEDIGTKLDSGDKATIKDGVARGDMEIDEQQQQQQQGNNGQQPQTSADNAGGEQAKTAAGADAEAATNDAANEPDPLENAMLKRPETTKSMAYRLLGVEIDYSSDEGGDEDCAYFIDGVDGTFSTQKALAARAAKQMDVKKGVGASDDGEHKSAAKADVDSDADTSSVDADSEAKTNESAEEDAKPKAKDSDAAGTKKGKAEAEVTLPVRRTDFTSLGDRSKLAVAVALSSKMPDPVDFDRYPLPSTKAVEEQRQKELEAQKKLEEIAEEKQVALQVKKSTVKIEQVSINTNEAVHVWANAETAAGTLQINLNQLRQILGGEYDEDLGDELGGFKWRYADVGAVVTAPTNEKDSKRKKKGREAWLEFRDKLYDPSEPHMYKNNNRLRDYQVEGVNWLASTFYRKHGCILADEMGLGKTVQIVTYIEHLFRVEKIRRPYLVVVPLSTVEHWRREFEGWTDMVCCVYHDRQRVWRDVLREYEWYYEDRPHTPEYLKFDVLVTTYDTLIGDFDVISQIPFRAAVVDEAHRLRNQKGKLLECMKEISAKGTLHYGYQSRVLMSGTPLQNDLTELWTLLNFIEPILFPTLDHFQAQFGNMANRGQVEALQQKISPFMLRRVKEDVAKDIPAKEETIIDVELTSIQKQYYRAIFEHNHAFLNMGTSRSSAPKLMNIQMELRKVCNHPCLLEGVEHREQERQFKEFLERGEFEGKSPEQQQHMLNEQMYIMSSGKMVLMDKLLPKLRQEGHKILIFSQMVRMLDLISEYCEFRSFPYERLDGRVRGTDRQKSIDRFERDSNSFLFLLSTRAGGVGINLTAADICIIFDSDWNPQNDVQAQARCHRIGQTKDVRIYRLVTSRTFEQEMFDRASKKLGLEQAVLGTFGQDNDDDKPTNKEMEQLLKKGAYALIEDENDEIGKAFCADDIDSILAKRTRTRVVEGAKTASWLNKQGMVVSKSKFTSDSKSAGLDMDDPLFWQKVMPDFITPTIMLQKMHDLSDEVFGTTTKRGRGRGRGRGRPKAPENEATNVDNPQNGETSSGNPNDMAADNKPEQQGDNAMMNGINDSNGGEEKKDNEIMNGDGTGKDANGHSKSDVVDMDVEGGGDGGKANEQGKSQNGGGDADADADENDEDDDDDDDEEEDGEKKYKLTLTNKRKVAKFMSDLKSMMDDIFDEAEDDALPAEEKQTAQKLLLTISVKEKLFSEDQRHLAKTMLNRLEGNRRRRCRTSDMPSTPKRRGRESSGSRTPIREELLITSTKKPKRKRRTKAEILADNERKRLAQAGGSDDEGRGNGDELFKTPSDDEAGWSDGDDIFDASKKKIVISQKEANRRRQWAAGDDAATAAGRAWPAFPRDMVQKVLHTVLEEVMIIDDANGGIFSVPVPEDEFPEYYDQIKKPMDYGTMQKKLERNEYRSVQAMQRDFILVMQNCLQFNSPNSNIVTEARQQALMRPSILRKAALKHNLFLAEDGSVLTISDETDKKVQANAATAEGAKGGATPKKRRRRRTKAEMEEARRKEREERETAERLGLPIKKKRVRRTKSEMIAAAAAAAAEKEKKAKEAGTPKIKVKVKSEKDSPASPTKKKPRIKLSLGGTENGSAPHSDKVAKRKRPDDDVTPAKTKEPQDSKEQAQRGTPVRKRTKQVSTPRRGNKKTRSSPHGDVRPGSSEAGGSFGDDGGSNDPGAVYFLLSQIRSEREILDTKFSSARRNLTKRGPWKLPNVLKDHFKEVALAAIQKMNRNDKYSVFVEAVTDSEAPGYFDVVKRPIDMSIIRQNVDDGKYGSGSEAATKFYEDVLLMFDNCALYNDEDGEVIEEATRLLGLIPEVFSAACVSVNRKKK